jgi:hypothetical protein
MANELDESFEGRQWLAPPVLGDVTEEAMLDLVPLAGAGREVTDPHTQVRLVGEVLELELPGMRSVPIAATG